MSVVVLVPGVLRTEAGGLSRIEVDAGGSLQAVFDEVRLHWPKLERRIRDERGEIRRYVNVYIDGRDCRSLDGQATRVVDGAEVQIIPSVAGGSGIDGNSILAEHFAPWVCDLGLTVEETGADHAVLRLPWSSRLAREGGALCGQALMAAADTATVIAVSAARGGFGPMTTVQMSTSFQRPVLGKDVLVTARLTKLGRSLAFADITMTAGDRLVAQASTVYALL